MLLGLLEPDPAPDAGLGVTSLADGAAGLFPDDLGGGDRGRFLRRQTELSVIITSQVQMRIHD